MAAAQQAGMDKAVLKKLLSVSKKEPVNCAVAMGADPGLGLLLLDKIKQPQALEKLLVKDYPDAKNPRRGTAFVDLDDDPKLVKFRINKPASGLARRLVKTLKGTGFSKVEIVLEDDTFVEAAGGEDEEEGADGAAQAAQAPAAAAAEAPAAQPAQAAPPDAGQVTRDLVTLVKRIQDVADPARKGQLAKLAAAVQAALKGGDVVGALKAQKELTAALDGVGGADGAAGGNARIQKLRQAWVATTTKARADAERVRSAIKATFPEEADMLDASFQGMFGSFLANLDAYMLPALDRLAASPSQEKWAVEGVRFAIKMQQGLLENEFFAQLDDNPFVPGMAPRRTMLGTLDIIAKSLA